MDSADLPETLTPRVRRAIGLMTIAVTVIVGASLYYLRPWEAFGPAPVTSKIALSGDANFGLTYEFQSSALGWAMEIKPADGAGGDGQFWIWRTVDGARHWEVQLHGKTADTSSTFLSFRFIDSRNGVVVGGSRLVLYRTTDGGAHWTSAPLPAQNAPAVQFVDVRHTWLSHGALASYLPQPLWLSADGGGTWTQLPAMPSDSSARPVFRDAQEGWIGASSPGTPHAYVTRDGGWTWKSVDIPARFKGTDEEPAWTWIELPPGDGLVANIGFRESFETMTTRDGGATWRDVGLADGRPVNSFSYLDAEHWWATFGDSLYKSEDAGNTWTPASNLPSDTHLLKVLDSRHAWAGPEGPGGGYLELTSDGGDHWTELRAPLAVS